MADELGTFFGDLKKRFKPGVVGKRTVYYFSLGDEKWTMTLTPRTCSAKSGKVENADCVVKTDAALFVKIMTGVYKPGITDFLTGKIKSNDAEKMKLLVKAFGL